MLIPLTISTPAVHGRERSNRRRDARELSERTNRIDRPTTILWLRRDLRLHDHPALVAAVDAARAGGGALLPIFIWEPGLYSGARSSGNRTWFVRESLAELRSELQSRGSTLLELRGPALVALPRLVEELRAGGRRAVDVFATRDHTPYARGRDQSVAEAIAALGGTLFQKYLLPFEIVSVLLLVAMVGVILLSKKELK